MFIEFNTRFDSSGYVELLICVARTDADSIQYGGPRSLLAPSAVSAITIDLYVALSRSHRENASWDALIHALYEVSTPVLPKLT